MTQLEALRAALIEGENSGTPQPFDLSAFKARMMAGHG
jgi:antitoxin ParD1/3/4